MESSTRKPALPEVNRRGIDGRILLLHTAIPAVVTKWDASKQAADCKPLVKAWHIDEEGNRVVDSLPVVPSCPVLLVGAGGFRDTFPISDGTLVIEGETIPATIGLLIFSERSLDKWLSGKGGEVDPEFYHDHADVDGVLVLGLNPFGAPLGSVPTDHATSGADAGVQIHYRKNTICIGDETGASFAALADKLLQRVQDIESKFDAHVHPFTGTVDIAHATCAGTTTATATPTAHAPDFAAAQAKVK